jgi:hypothetical protein
MSRIIKEYIRLMPYILSKPNIESNAYNNCLLIQKCIDTLDKNCALSDVEKDVLTAVFSGFSFVEIAKILGISNRTASAVFTQVTDRIAFILGGEFSDSSLYDSLENYHLTAYMKPEEEDS